MNSYRFFHVKKNTLLAVAGTVWFVAGFNVARLGAISYSQLYTASVVHVALSLFVFAAFGIMFYKMARKHARRILGYEQERRPVWHFFDLKAYLIMTFMMGGGIWLRASGLLPNAFIAVFYTGLGCALAVAGIVFWWIFGSVKKENTAS